VNSVDSKQIRELVELVSGSDLESLELESEGFKLRLVRRGNAAVMVAPASAAPGVPVAVEAPAVAPPQAVQGSEAPAETPVDDGLVEMKAPIVGTFYTAPSPSSPPFVEVGTRVSKGKVMCIIEAMKVMNEIEAEINAEVVEVVVVDGQPVEYGEALFRLRPL
jgi:acetyl-CoA carboxylase biotin carboxyl carrier protein